MYRHSQSARMPKVRETEKGERAAEGAGQMKKSILIQYAEMVQEVKDLRNRINKISREIADLSNTIVADTVKGTRKDGTYGPIKIEGLERRESRKKEAILKRYKLMLEIKEAELLELMTEAEKYIEDINNSELRTMFRIYYIDGMNWMQTAAVMNRMFPKRKIKYTDENCRKRNDRYFEKVSDVSNNVR